MEVTLRVAEQVFTASAEVKPRKAQPRGVLVDRQGPPSQGVNSSVIKLLWSELEPRRGQVDIAMVEAELNRHFAAGSRSVLLRVYGGANAPAWVKQQVGSYDLGDPQEPSKRIVTAQTWRPAYLDAAEGLDRALAARFDQDPLICAATAWWGGWEFSAEWTIRNAGLAANRDLIMASGFTPDRDLEAIREGFRRHSAIWAHTPSQTFLSTAYQRIVDNGRGGWRVQQDPDETERVLRDVIEDGCPNLEVGVNHVDKTSYQTTGGDPLVRLADQLARQYGLRRRDQSETLAKLGGNEGLRLALLAGAGKVDCYEMPAGWQNAGLDMDDMLERFAAR